MPVRHRIRPSLLHGPVEQPIHGRHRRLHRRRRAVAVDARGHPRAGVSEDVCDRLERHPRGGQQTGGAVPQLVRVPASGSRRLGDCRAGRRS